MSSEQTLVSKFVLLTLTQRRFIKQVDSFGGIAAGDLAYSFDTPTLCGLITIAVWLIVSAIAAIIFNKKAK